MQLENFGPDSRRGAAPEHLELGQTPEVIANNLLRTGDQQITALNSHLEMIGRRANEASDPSLFQELNALRNESDQAWLQLRADIENTLTEKPITEETETSNEVFSIFDTPISTPSDFEGEIDLSGSGTSAAEAAIPTEQLKVGLEAILDDTSANFAELDRFIDTNAEELQTVQEHLTNEIGKAYCDRLFNDPVYREQLKTLQASLSTRLGEHGPEICDKRSIHNLVVIHETLGEHAAELATSLDLHRYGIDEERLPRSSTRKSIISVGSSYFAPEGFSSLSVHVSHHYSVQDRAYGPIGASSSIQREFTKRMQQNNEGENIPHLEVQHEVFELPAALEGRGIAAKIFSESLKHYDQIGADEITLKADIDVGSYAWASYGFGWRPKAMDAKKISAVISLLTAKIETALETLDGTITPDQKATVLEQLKQAQEHPLAITPQFLAGIGNDMPRLRRGYASKDRTRIAFYTEEQFEALKKDDPSIVDERYSTPMHLGKIGLLDNTWDGSLPLKGAEQDPTHPRHLLNNKLQKSVRT